MRTIITHFGVALVCLGIPGPLAQGQLYSLSSDVTYTGSQTGEVWVVASAFETPVITNFNTRLSVPSDAPFTNATATIEDLVGTYWLLAWRDSIANGVPDPTEAQGWHPDNPIAVLSNVTVGGFVIEDPDNDIDGLPDWWEARYGLSTGLGSGSAGMLALELGETNFTDTVRASVLGTNDAGSANLNVSTTSGFGVNDLVMIVTMQDPDTNFAQNTAGTYEFGRIASLSSNAMTLTRARSNTFTVSTSEKIQVLKVPEYTEVALEGSPSVAALHLDGTTNSYVVADSFAGFPADEITMELWMRTSDTTNDGTPLSYAADAANNNMFMLYRYTDFVVYIDNQGTSTGVSANDGEWHHIAVTWRSSDGEVRLYKDGLLAYSNNVKVGATLPSGGTLVLGQDQDSLGGGFQGWQSFLGELDEVRIWNTVRSEPEIQANMYLSLNGTEPGLVCYYRLDEGAGTDVADATGLGHDGTIAGAPMWLGPAVLTCEPWDGTGGGVLAFLAHDITLGSNSLISADGKGYRGVRVCHPPVPMSSGSRGSGPQVRALAVRRTRWSDPKAEGAPPKARRLPAEEVATDPAVLMGSLGPTVHSREKVLRISEQAPCRACIRAGAAEAPVRTGKDGLASAVVPEAELCLLRHRPLAEAGSFPAAAPPACRGSTPTLRTQARAGGGRRRQRLYHWACDKFMAGRGDGRRGGAPASFEYLGQRRRHGRGGANPV